MSSGSVEYALPAARRHREAFLELTLAIAIIIVLLTSFMADWGVVLAKVRMLEAVISSGGERAEAMIARAQSGRFGAASSQSVQVRGRTFEEAAWEDGELVFALADRAVEHWPERQGPAASEGPLTLSLRMATALESGATIWLCGRREPPRGFEAPAARHTTIPARYAPHFCRSRAEGGADRVPADDDDLPGRAVVDDDVPSNGPA